MTKKKRGSGFTLDSTTLEPFAPKKGITSRYAIKAIEPKYYTVINPTTYNEAKEFVISEFDMVLNTIRQEIGLPTVELEKLTEKPIIIGIKGETIWTTGHIVGVSSRGFKE